MPFIEASLTSALEQMCPGDELLVQDGGSTDGTLDVIAGIEKGDARVRTEIAPDKGQSDALNKALARAKPSWVIWLNADDVIMPGALEAVRKAIVANPEGEVFYGAHRLLREDGSYVELFQGRPLDVPLILRWGITSFSGSIVMRDDTLRGVGGLKVDLHFAMDMDLQLRIARTSLRQVNIAAPIGALRFHDTSKSGSKWQGFVRDSYRVRMDHARTPLERFYGLAGVAWHLAVIPGFRLRMSPAYRAIRRRKSPQPQ